MLRRCTARHTAFCGMHCFQRPRITKSPAVQSRHRAVMHCSHTACIRDCPELDARFCLEFVSRCGAFAHAKSIDRFDEWNELADCLGGYAVVLNRSHLRQTIMDGQISKSDGLDLVAQFVTLVCRGPGPCEHS